MAGLDGYKAEVVEDLRARYDVLREAIRARLVDFRQLGQEGAEEELFAELVFCLFTPQSKAKSCWAAVERLRECDLLLCGEAQSVACSLQGVRFHHTKAANLVRVRELFTRDGELAVRQVLDGFADGREAREWLAASVRGLGYKEATHFLRNVGRGDGMAILDRHVMRNLVALGALAVVPGSLSRKRYVEVEEAMVRAAEALGIPVEELDLLLWSKETAEIFK
jgi:N-glycosylase/DNA lyase